MYDILNLQLEGQSEIRKLVPCVNCGMYSIFNIDNYVLIESTDILNSDGTLQYTCNACKDKMLMSYQIEDLNRKVTKLRERVVSLKLIRNMENEIDNSANIMLANSFLTNQNTDDLAARFANISLSSDLPNNYVTSQQSTLLNIDEGSCDTSVWDSDPSTTVLPNYDCTLSNLFRIPDDTHNNDIHRQSDVKK